MVKQSVVLLGMALMGARLPAQQAAVIAVNPSVVFQKMTGWEATLGLHVAENPAFPYFKDRLFDQAVNDLGINRVRLEVKSGIENSRDYSSELKKKLISAPQARCYRYATVNDNDDPFTINWSGFHFTDMDANIEQLLLPIKKRLEARGEKLFLNVNYVAFYKSISSPGCPPGLRYDHENSEEYAEFVLATYLHLKSKYGLVPDTWEFHLEPDNTPYWRGKQIGEAIAAAAKRLKANGFKPAFVAPSTTDMSNASPYFDEMIKVPGVLENLAEFSYHRYRGVSDAVLRGIGERAVRHKVNTAQLEHIASGYEDLHKDLTIGRNSSWSQYGLASTGAVSPAATDEWTESMVTGPLLQASKSGDQKAIDTAVARIKTVMRDRVRYSGDFGGDYYIIEARDPTKPQIVMGSRTKFLRQYFKYVRKGAVRIEATSTDQAVDPVAFINANGGYVVVVKAVEGRSFSVKGLPAGVYGIKFTTTNQYDVDLPDVPIKGGQQVVTRIPAAGVLTVYAKAAKSN